MPNEIPLTLFQTLYNRAPTEADRQRLLAVKVGLGLSDRDELWPVIMVFDHYMLVILGASKNTITAFRTIPSYVATAIAEGFTAIEKRLAYRNDLSIARAIDNLTKQILQSTAHGSQPETIRFNRKQVILVASIVSVVSLLCLVTGGYGGYWITNSIFEMCTLNQIIRTEDGRIVCIIK